MANILATATRAVFGLVALAVVLSAVTAGGVAQTDSGNSTASAGDAEPNDTVANATSVDYGEEIGATLSSPNDVDYYAVNVTAGEAVVPRLRLKNTVEGGAIQVDVVAPDGEVTTELTNDQMTGPQNTAGPATIVRAEEAYTGDVAESSGTYYVRVMEVERTYAGRVETNESDTYRYSLTVNRTAVDAHEPNENGTTATSLELGESVDAAVAGYDSDVYAVNLTAGRNYTVRFDSPNGSRYSYAGEFAMWVYENRSAPVDDPDNGSAYHFDPTGTPVATKSSLHGENESLLFTPEANGTHYVQIVQGGQNANLLDLAPYELTVNETPANDEMANAAPIAYYQDVVTNLSRGETDWYAVDGRAGASIVADVREREDSHGNLRVGVVGPNGEVVTERPTDDTLPQAATDVMESNDTYYVRVRESASESDAGGEANASPPYGYIMTVETDTIDAHEPNENGATAAPLELGETTDAMLKSYDSDVYAVNATAGRTYEVRVDVPERKLNTVLLVYDGASAATDDPSPSNATPVARTEGDFYEGNLTFTAAENGTYYLQLVENASDPWLYERSNYNLTVRESGGESAPDGGDGDGPPSDGDADGDGLANGREREIGTDPRAADTDDDGPTDDCELENDTDPTDPDTDDDGTPDGREV